MRLSSLSLIKVVVIVSPVGSFASFRQCVAMKASNLKRAVLPFIPLTPYAEAVVVEPH